jgi:hypothetical protein
MSCVQVDGALSTPALTIVLLLVICAFLLVAQFAGAHSFCLMQQCFPLMASGSVLKCVRDVDVWWSAGNAFRDNLM